MHEQLIFRKDRSQEVIFEVGYFRKNTMGLACTLVGMAVTYGYALPQGHATSALMSVAVGIFGTVLSMTGGLGHACLLTPQKKILSLLCFSALKERSKVPETLKDDLTKHPRIQIHIQANDAQLEMIENSKFVPSTTCSHGSSRLLARAGLPHAFFPISLSPTWTVSYLENLKKQHPAIKEIRYLNWSSDDSKMEIKFASVSEQFLMVFASAFVVVLASKIADYCSKRF